jgi:hypothetical protein
MKLSMEGGRLGGIALMREYLPHSSGFVVSPGLEGTPVFHGHGESDPLVGLEAANNSWDAITSKKSVTNYQLVTYPNLAHLVSLKEILDLLAFLKEVIPPDNCCRLKLKDPGNMSVKELRSAIAWAGLGRMAVGLAEKLEFVGLEETRLELVLGKRD